MLMDVSEQIPKVQTISITAKETRKRKESMDMMLQLMNENGQGSKSRETEQQDEVRNGKERAKAFLRSKYEYYKRLDEIRS